MTPFNPIVYRVNCSLFGKSCQAFFYVLYSHPRVQSPGSWSRYLNPDALSQIGKANISISPLSTLSWQMAISCTAYMDRPEGQHRRCYLQDVETNFSSAATHVEGGSK